MKESEHFFSKKLKNFLFLPYTYIYNIIVGAQKTADLGGLGAK